MAQPSYAKDAFDVIDKLDRLMDVNAVMDALQIRHADMPLTPAAVWCAITMCTKAVCGQTCP